MINEKEKELVSQIIEKYQVKEENKIDELKALDKKVKRFPTIFAYTFGTLAALIFGAGMSLAMKVIGDAMILGIIVGVVGIVLVSVNYLIYKKLLANQKEKYRQDILTLSDQLLNK